MAENETHTVDAGALTSFCTDVFTAAGVPFDEASVIAASLVDANLIGLDSHGVSRVADYLGRLDQNLVNPKTELTVVSETAGTALLDANNGWGQVASQKAVEIAIDKARTVGTAWVGVTNSNHNGTASYWTRKIAEAGMIGISGTNSSPVMAPFGGKDASLGTNPISIAVPTKDGPSVVLDMATSAQARGKIIVAAKNGEAIPLGWALDARGQPTTDAKEALNGTLLPMAGPKGSGLAIMVDILAGVLNGASFGADMPRMYGDSAPQLLGHFFIALDISAMTPLSEFLNRMATREDQTRNGAPATGYESVLMPGDLEARKRKDNLRTGLLLSRSIFDELVATARSRGIEKHLA
ncbi:MAG: Ldh family oxidoreductase [Arthrobacter sp.]